MKKDAVPVSEGLGQHVKARVLPRQDEDGLLLRLHRKNVGTNLGLEFNDKILETLNCF